MACAHSVVPLLQISQMSGTTVPGHGFMIGGGWQSVEQSKTPFESHLQVVPQFELAPLLVQAVPGLQEAPGLQSGGVHVVLH